MAPSTEYHKRSHSRSEVLRFSCALKNAVLFVYYRRYTKRTTAFLKGAVHKVCHALFDDF